MKNYYKGITAFVMLSAIAFVLTTCQKETINPPTVKVFEGAITLNYTSASVSAEVTDQGGAEVKSRGFIYGQSGGNQDTIFCGSGMGVFSAELKNLHPNTTYVYEAFARNASGTAYSGKVTFTTRDYEMPTVKTADAENVTITSATVGGEVVNDGGGAVTERGVCWSTNHNPVTGNNHVTAGQGTGTFTCTMANLSANTTYYYRAYAKNTKGTAYGEEKPLETLDYDLPEVTTDSIIDITQTTAKGGGEVTNEGGADVTERGICWSTNHNPTIEDNHVGAGEGLGSFTCDMTNLNANTKYYVRAYAKNEKGPAYGDEVSFKTSKVQYTISVSANPANGGTVNGGGTYPQGESCTVEAMANDGYVFTNWTENGNVVSESDNYTFTVNGNRTLVANFIRTYTITVSANPSNGGTVTGGGTYQQGQTLTLRATPSVGYVFQKWTKDGTQVSTNPTVSITVTGDASYVAHFTVQSYTISASSNPSNGGTVTGGGTYNQGQSCTLSATAADGYTFTKWTENGTQVSTNANYTFTVTGNRTLVAHFSVQPPNTYNINVSANPSNGGMVTGGGTYQQGQQCTVTATANAGYTFLRWTENGNPVSTTASYTFTVSRNRTLVAHFQAQNYTISVSANPTNGGTVSGGGSYNYGQSCTVHATAASGYTFLRWTENGNQVSTNANYTFTVTSNRTLVAQFQAQGCTINVSASPSNGGTVSGGGTYPSGSIVTLIATPNPGYTFVNWTMNGTPVSTNAVYSLVVTQSATYVAHFQAQGYTISVSANPTSGGSVSGGGSYNYGQSCTVHATAASGYTFLRWTENGNQVSTNANYTFTVTSNRTLVAQFQAQGYTISVSANPTSGGSVSGGGSYNYGQSCTVSATAATGYTFLRWTENGTQVSTNANYTFTVTSNRTLVAQFQAQGYTISVSANPTSGGSVSGGGSYNYGQSCTVTASAASGYTFLRWTENGNQVSTNANYTFTVTNNRSLVANFTAQPQAPTGAISGVFSVEPTTYVYFSQGNLQYQASTQTWRFANHQYDVVGSSNSDISQTNPGWIDLFGWGTSGWDCGNTYYRPWDSNNSNGSLYGPPGSNNLSGSYANSDWGRYNAISNGGNQTGQWRTLTNSEWNYVLTQRNTPSGIRYAKAQVNGVNGVILLPDNWSASTYSLSSTNQGGASFSSNVISASQWNTLQNAGAVFLPAAGIRIGTSVNDVGSDGYYWSASYSSSYGAYSVYFDDSSLGTSNFSRYCGRSVRLVCPAEN